MEPHQVPKCLLSRLRTIRIDQFECTEHEFGLIRYLLRNGKVLERMEICSEREETEWEANVDALMRISSFQRGSEACELVFH
ncbi:F-box/FBD/LRR-repeat protein at5g56570 [Phtheirospermum japonicum]|nr:F-box/FBD/LRR-repeat protein at5g56570 [Phtheirospermum japonicum]GFQ08414.1 F-box/FBD/LRR-repeat protein at5g56570 [Phtheirospermum japonicum]